MVKQDRFHLVYATSKSVYSSGETIKGNVVLVLEQPLKLRGIRVTFFGKAHVKWTERLKTAGGDRKDMETIEQTAEEIYFNERQLVWGQESESDHSDVLPIGSHEFPFTFTLPPNLPSSFESLHGYVRYYARATIDKAWKKDDHVQKSFAVSGHHDNQQQHSTDSFNYSAEETVCCGCCRMGEFSVCLSMEKRGFSVGESLGLSAKINNKTTNRCMSQLLMKMNISLYSQDQVKTEEIIIGESSHLTSPGTTDTWMVPIQIPDVPPSGLAGCGIIDPKYTLQYTLEPTGCNCDSIEVYIGIVVGTTPVITNSTCKLSEIAPKVSSDDL